MLRGETTEAVLRHRHDKLPTFGVGADHAAPFWRGLIRQLIALGALDVDTAGPWRPVPGPGQGAADPARRDAGDAAAGSRRVRSRVERPERGRVAAVVPVGGGGTPPYRSGARPVDATLFEALRLWRAAEAKGQSMPPYVIFHDTVLRDIAAVRPPSLDELGQIKGVGASKLQRYGRHVLGVLSAQIPDGLAKRG